MYDNHIRDKISEIREKREKSEREWQKREEKRR